MYSVSKIENCVTHKNMSEKKPHVAMFPSAGMGHLMPFLHLARTLAIHHGFSVTFIATKTKVSHPETAHIEGLLSSGLDIRVIELALDVIESSSVGQDRKNEDPFFVHWEAIGHSMAAFERIIRSLVDNSSSAWAPICAVITDMALSSTLDVTAKFNLPNYILFPSSAFMLGFMLYFPLLLSQGHNLSDPNLVLDIPGFPPLPTTDISPALKINDHIFFRIFVSSASNAPKASGILINTFHDLEAPFLHAIQNRQILNNPPPIYPIGPIFLPSLQPTMAATGECEELCLQWLDAQPANSVVYVSFGSRSALPSAQINELAMGLEASRQRFLWVLKTSVVAKSASDPISVLPPGFQSRVSDRGLIVSSWVPQAAILSHMSVGGFVSHCGWNSVVESISHGIPVIAWPLSGDQMINARLLINTAKVGLAIKKGEEGNVSREEVEKTVRCLMQEDTGKELKRRATVLKEHGRRSVSEGGPSEQSLLQAIQSWKKFSSNPT
eukprot:Gb_18055 [translate_table: standard]